jgi:hypothetical protein
MSDHQEAMAYNRTCFCNFVFFLKVFILFFALFPPASIARPREKATLGMCTGVAGILDHNKLLLGSLEYRPTVEFHTIRPWAGMEFGYDIIYLAGGILTNMHVTDQLVFTPSFGVGIYSSNEGLQLGSILEFRSGVELSYGFHNNTRLGIHYGHISNGGLGHRNPGSEILKVIYYFPF